jgi:iron complex outermembrane receptor protein
METLMKKLQLLPLTLLILGSSVNSHAEQISLPSISVEGVSGEVTPYALPALSASTADLGDMVKRLPGANVNRNGIISSIAQYRGLYGHRVNVQLDGTGNHQSSFAYQ